MDLSHLNIFDIASHVMEFLQKGLLVLEHEGVAVQPAAINPVNGRIVLSTKAIQALVAPVAAVVAAPSDTVTEAAPVSAE